MSKPVHSYQGFVILELKFTNRHPTWFRELVRVADAVQCGAAKCVSSVNELGRTRLRANAEVIEEESQLSCFRAGDDLPVRERQDKGVPVDRSRL